MPLGPGLTVEHARRIRPGMTLAEVNALLGKPPAPHHGCYIDFEAGPAWTGAEGAVCVLFGADGRARRAYWATQWGQGRRLVAPPQRTPGLLSRLRAWLGW